jgi:uncharacterized protein YjbI with pentapeptide repeats
LAVCRFTCKYFVSERSDHADFECEEPALDSGFCLFHDEDYLRNSTNSAERYDKVKERLNEIINESITNAKPLICIGYYLPDIELKKHFTQDLIISNSKIRSADFRHSKFEGKVQFSNSEFLGAALFSSTKFFKRADFREARFFGAADYREAEFLGEVDLFKALFDAEADFSNTMFYKSSQFTEMKFSKPAKFTNATFSDEVSFSETKFAEGATFLEADFMKAVNLIETRFQYNSSFESSHFHGLALFFKGSFSGLANFRLTEFSTRADFGEAGIENSTFVNTKFHGPVEFLHTTFGPADFSESIFTDLADFKYTRFTDSGNFKRVISSKQIDFSNAEFSKEAHFAGARLQEAAFIKTNFARVNFSGASFMSAHFTDAHFQELGTFSNSNFQKTCFHNSIFHKGAIFYSANFLGQTYFSAKFNDKTSFNYVLFEEGGKIHFDIGDLSKVSFINSDITRVRFSEKAVWGRGDRFKITDEEKLEEIVKTEPGEVEKIGGGLSLGSVMAVYRNLRENYEYRLRYQEAGKFFIREMELKRNYRENYNVRKSSGYQIKKNNWWRRNIFSLTAWYYHLARYGEDLLRPTLAGIIIVLLSTILWLTQSNPSTEPKLCISCDHLLSHFIGLSQVGNQTQWEKAFERGFSDFFPLLPPGSKGTVLIDYIIKILGGVLSFALLAIALRRKFERKFRH